MRFFVFTPRPSTNKISGSSGFLGVVAFLIEVKDPLWYIVLDTKLLDPENKDM